MALSMLNREVKMRELILATTSVLALGVGAVDVSHAAGTGGLAPNARSDMPAASAAAIGVTGDEVRQAQQQLRNLGLYRGALDGIAGPATKQALQQFQMSNGLAVTTTLDPQTMARLIGSRGVGQAASTPPNPNQANAVYPVVEEVREAQQRLRDIGLYHGAIDGIFGPQTRDAVARFQTISGLAVTAALDQQTMSRLLPRAGVGTGSSTPQNPAQGTGPTTTPGPAPSGR
jgi:peptidoglycan hydrolase-like protein with peptidoglycan-binding domain